MYLWSWTFFVPFSSGGPLRIYVRWQLHGHCLCQWRGEVQVKQWPGLVAKCHLTGKGGDVLMEAMLTGAGLYVSVTTEVCMKYHPGVVYRFALWSDEYSSAQGAVATHSDRRFPLCERTMHHMCMARPRTP